ncbi:alpha/beta hydrolase [Thalassolituus marinus]|uniref:Alpha/beta fold hydrolase n=1 Tax=Thalassolituus marinus TaxID=671053 RepID=A0ABS7ZKV0_9GAMM|nr:alpha/beta fold hydrolase [Thalassolituus marinus]MCA6062351.1 alpha/beta fold hydrolase [Thalassolituus marinus]
MKSSSQLFPVSLLRADVFGSLTEDVYLVKHNLDDDKSVQIAVSHLGLAGVTASKGPVVLLHGSFSNRGFWLSAKGEGLARHLAENGFDVWMMEMRGHGLSPRNHQYSKNTLEQYVLHDLPAVNAFVKEKSGASPAWIGHSLGGVVIASAIAAGTLAEADCRAIVLLGSQAIRRPWYQWIPGISLSLRAAVRSKGEMDGRKHGIGPENEPAALISEYLKRHSLLGSWQLPAQRKKLLPLWKQGTQVPLLALAAAADSSDPARYCTRFADMYGGEKTVETLGVQSGLSKDYGHVDMIVSPEAAREVWPRITSWLS